MFLSIDDYIADLAMPDAARYLAETHGSAEAKEDKRMNEKALDAFITKTMNARDILDTIRAELDEHMNVNPDKVNWAHVGDIGHVTEMLNEIAQFLGHNE